ncbi:MAG: cytochrome C biogenesis protein CycH [Acidobacteria bacterium]|nr:cytochrome C biogenesis protein CycH [Acidobacteriota bacterium]
MGTGNKTGWKATNRSRRTTVREPASAFDAPGGGVALYRAADGTIALDVRLERETLWLNLNQIAGLFERDKSVISRHLNNVFKTGELERDSVVALFATTAADGKTYQVEHFNLDAILSVGYRVNSKRGTQFRIWATDVLREHVLSGYTVNERRLDELQRTVRLVARVMDQRQLSGDEAAALLRVVTHYGLALDLLDDYDRQRMPALGTGRPLVRSLSHAESRRIVDRLRVHFQAGELFGRESGPGLRSALAAVAQTVDGRDAYPSLEEKAAHLLYFIVKNHAFVDGNKRIGAALFLWFLEKNGALFGAEEDRRISDAALVALTLMIAESRPAEKDMIVRLTTRLLQNDQG